MRYVDIEGAHPDAGWLERAERALDELRAEINAAELQAVALAQDVAIARRQAIRRGLDVRARQDLWRELAPTLSTLRKGKCWYSESRNPGSDKNIDHFRPKARVEEDPAHEGYWWLAFTWRNFRYACQWCNQLRRDKVNRTGGGKGDRFPLAPGSFRARCETDDCDAEDVDLLDPTDPLDWKLLTFRPDGRPTPATAEGTREHARAAASIEIYHLDCAEFVNDRRILAGRVERLVQDLERLRAAVSVGVTGPPADIANDPGMRALYKAQLKELLRLIHEDAEYSAAALAYARAAIYRRHAGSEVKRQWLEDILSATS